MHMPAVLTALRKTEEAPIWHQKPSAEPLIC